MRQLGSAIAVDLYIRNGGPVRGSRHHELLIGHDVERS
jgi:hypothetical protein